MDPNRWHLILINIPQMTYQSALQ